MKTSRFSDSQIVAVHKQVEGRSPVPELCREHGIGSAMFYKWRSKLGGMDASLMARLKELEDENLGSRRCVPKNVFKPKSSRRACKKKW